MEDMAPREGYRHSALLYAGEDEFVDHCASFIRAGVAAEEPTLVVVSARKIELLREALDGDRELVSFADMARVGRNPARIIPAWQEFVRRHAASGRRVRGIGEPVFPGRSADELVESQRHESLLNMAFSDAKAFRLLCPYDTEALPPKVIQEARRSHPHVTVDGSRDENSAYEGIDAATFLGASLPDPPATADELAFADGSLAAVRRFVAERAARAGLETSRRIDLVVAAGEIATNSLRHGGGKGIVRMWSEPGRLLCEIRDRGRLEDPLADRRVPWDDEPAGRGFWIANQLCDLVQVRSSPTGTVVRLHISCD